MNSPRPIFVSLLLRLLAFAAPLVFVAMLATSANADVVGSPVTVGITGHYRTGSWTAIRLQPTVVGEGDETLIETVDGEGTRTVYRHDYAVGASRFGYCVPGGEAVPLIVRGGSRAAPLLRTRFPESDAPANGPAMVPLEMPWVVVFGDPVGLPTVGANELLGRAPQVAASLPANPEQLPDSVLGYDGVDMIVVNASGRQLLSRLSPDQSQAITDWVLGGGRLLIGLGETAAELIDAAPWLLSLLPLERSDLSTLQLMPSGFETYLSSPDLTQLGRFEGARLPDRMGQVMVDGRTASREKVPLAVEYVAGLGRVIAVAVDLDRAPMAQWPNRLELIERLSGDSLVRDEPFQRSNNRRFQYADLAGQARNTLDRFSVHRPFSFSLITLILAGLIALIGPLDYLLINHLLGRPLLGWLTFPLIAVLLSVALVVQAGPRIDPTANSDSTLRRNRIEIVDIDSIRRIGSGFSWTYLYSHRPRRLDVSVQPAASLEAVAKRPELLVAAPFGWPGTTFGGIQIAGEDSRMPAYEIELTRGKDANSGSMQDGAFFRASLRGLPLAPRSSKSFATRLRFQPQLGDVEPIARRRGTDLLEGPLTNPLPFDLLDGMLVYRNWAYLLPTRLPAGARIDAVETLRQKNFRWQLARQRAIEDSTEGGVWDPSLSDDPRRIAEMLMFHDAAGGSRYTTLQHAPLSFLDLSSLLTTDRCMLVGRAESPLTELRIGESAGHGASGSSIESDAPGGKALTMIRVVMPITFTRPDP